MRNSFTQKSKTNHFHILLEVPPMPVGGISDEELLKRLSATDTEAFVAVVGVRAEGREPWVAEIHARFTYRMHDLSEFMKTLLQRLTRWFNRTQQRSGTLWKERSKSVIVENGAAARTMAAYIDLNPVRAGMASDPAEYRWSNYGEAVGGGPKGEWEKGARGTGQGVHEPMRRGFRGGAVAGGFADLPADDGVCAGEDGWQGGGGEGRGSPADDCGGSVRGGKQGDGFAGFEAGSDVALPGEVLHRRGGD